MSFDWVKFIKLAENLHLQNTEECFRTAVSRAYFGAFCLIRNYKGYKEYTEPDVHYKVIKSLKTSASLKEKEMGKLIDDLRRHRNLADYDEEKEVNGEISERCILKANKILEMMR